MALKFKCKSKDEIPAGLEAHYVERDGAWVLDAEGAADKAKVEEFRATNVTLMKERDELKKRFEGIDPDEVRRLSEEKQRLEEAQQSVCANMSANSPTASASFVASACGASSGRSVAAKASRQSRNCCDAYQSETRG